MSVKVSSRIVTVLVVAAFVAACSDDDQSVSREAAPGGAITVDTRPSGGSDFDPVEAYEDDCPSDRDELSLECEWLRGLIVAEVVEALEAIEESRDRRGMQEAVSALDIADEPEVLVAACRVIGHFPDTPGIAEKLTTLLLKSRYLEVRRMAAEVLARGPDPGFAAVANQWLQHHSALESDDVYARTPRLPAHYATLGFPEYPDAERYPPADSDRSVGWSSTDSAAAVTKRIGKLLDTEPMDSNAWMELGQRRLAHGPQAKNVAAARKIGQLSEAYAKSQDPAHLARIEALQDEINASMTALDDDAEMSVDSVVMPADFSQPDQIKYFVAEEKAGRVARVVLVYPQSGLDRTIIQTAWDLRDYPAAWPER